MRETSTDYRHPRRPAPVAWLNRAGRLAGGLGRRALRLDAAALLAAARRRTGHHDLGEDAAGFEDRLVRLVEAIETESRLHPVGRLMARENLIRIVGSRLRFEADWRAHPEIAATPLTGPMVVVGLQRTGTTLLHRLLASDPATRWLASWEAVNPAPLPRGEGLGARLGASLLARLQGNGRTAADLADPRIRAAVTAEVALRYLSPDFFAIHPVQAESPEEDCLLFDLALLGTVPEATMRVPSFSAWLEAQDKRPAYQYLKRMLRYLAWQRRPPGAAPGAPVRWVLKTPQHLEDLDALLAVFPEARILQTHRDPATVLASFSSMLSHGLGLFTDAVDPEEVAAHWTAKARRMVTRSMAVRRALGPWQEARTFYDVPYEALVENPLAVVRRIYAWMGRALTPEALSAMSTWRERNPQHRYGRHRYRAADFGLDPARVQADFAAYRARFKIPVRAVRGAEASS